VAHPEETTHDRALLIVAGVLVLAATIPTLLANASLRSGELFSGFLILPSDQHQYLAWMRDAAAGDWLLPNRYTADATGDVVVRPLFVVLGKIARVLDADPRAVYEASRWVLGLACLVALDRFFALWLRPGKRLGALVLAATASGVDVLLHAAGVRFTALDGDLPGFPVGHWWTDLYVGQLLTYLPHLLFAVALLLWSVTGLVRWWRAEGALWRGLLPAFVLAIEHPPDVAILLAWSVALGVAHVAARGDRGRVSVGLGGLALCTVPTVAGVAALLASDPTWARILEESLVQASPSPVLLALGLGVPLLFALPTVACGLDALRKREASRYEAQVAATLLLGAHLVLPYLPFDVQRRLGLALIVPVALAAWLWLRHRKPAVGVALLAVCAVGTPLNLADNLRYLDGAVPSERDVYYPSASLVDLLSTAETEHGVDHVVFCDARVGMLVPAVSGLRVVQGHSRHTPGFADKGAAWRTFIAPPTPLAARLDVARSAGADWVLFRIGGDPAHPDRAAEIAHYRRLREVLGGSPLVTTLGKNAEWELLRIE